jgi:hypothetical protein
MSTHYAADKVASLLSLFNDANQLENMPINELMDQLAK